MHLYAWHRESSHHEDFGRHGSTWTGCHVYEHDSKRVYEYNSFINNSHDLEFFYIPSIPTEYVLFSQCLRESAESYDSWASLAGYTVSVIH